ncbi:MAG: hypothetical protein ABI847_15395, partial [Anaerolineales bacterium]
RDDGGGEVAMRVTGNQAAEFAHGFNLSGDIGRPEKIEGGDRFRQEPERNGLPVAIPPDVGLPS